MATYLERYLTGEREQVWTELQSLGDAVREEPVYGDAWAVARETMRRARHNIEMLIPRLVAVGYQFGYGWIQPFVRERLTRPYRAHYDRATGQYTQGTLLEPTIPDHFGTRLRAEYEAQQDAARDEPPLFLPANDREERIALLMEKYPDWASAPLLPDGSTRHYVKTLDELRARPTASQLVAELESTVGTLPLSIRAWYEVVGGVNFVGDHPGWHQFLPAVPPIREEDYLSPMHWLDPLFIYPLDERRVALYRKYVKPPSRPTYLTLSADESGKYLDGARSFLQVTVPDGAADATLHREPGYQMSFIPYLREVFRWGGFPGWARLERRPEDDLAFLREKLLPL